MAKKCMRCDLTRIYAQFDAKAAKAAAPIKAEVVVAAPAPKRPTRKKKVEEPIIEAPIAEEASKVVVEEPIIEEIKEEINEEPIEEKIEIAE
jgi:hypothetical protein